ncbi:pentapeptide repeat-containing protein [Sedimentitalea sp. HM32M-2]
MQTTTLTIPPELFWGLAALAGLLVLTAVVFGALSLVANDRVSPVERMRDALGLSGLNGGVFFLALCLWATLFLSLVAGLLWLIWQVIYTQPPGSRQAVWDWRFTLGQMVALTGVLGAVVALPFTLVRIRLSREQTAIADQQKRIADEALFNDKIKAAADDLHARRQIKRISRLENPDEPDFIEDDIMRRFAAIDRLQVLAQERPDEAPRITRMLCVYLRLLSKEIGPDNPEHPRADMEAAAQTIGRMKRFDNVEPDKIEIDLRGANLAGFDLSGLCFDRANLSRTKLAGTNFASTSIRFANLRFANMQNTVLLETSLSCSDLSYARLQGLSTQNVKMQGVLFERTQLDRLSDLGMTRLRGACFYCFDLSEGPPDQNIYLEEVYGDGSVTLAQNQKRPAHWPDDDLRWQEMEPFWRAWQKEIGFDPDDPATW